MFLGKYYYTFELNLNLSCMSVNIFHIIQTLKIDRCKFLQFLHDLKRSACGAMALFHLSYDGLQRKNGLSYPGTVTLDKLLWGSKY